MKDHRLSCLAAIGLLPLLLVACVCSRAGAQTPNSVPANIITLGVIAGSHQQEISEHFAPFVSYLSRKVFSAADTRGRVVVAGSLPELARLLDQKTVDFFMESPYPTYVINQVHGAARLLLRRWKGGLAEYRSLIVTAKDNGINGLQNLRGNKIAFEDPESTSGYYLPKFFLQRNGFKLTPATEKISDAQPATIAYLFAGSVEKILQLVLTNQVAGGTISDDDFATLNEEKKAALRILAQTDLLPRHLVSVRKDFPLEWAERLAQALQAMPEDPAGAKILLNTDNTTKFDLLPGGEEGMRRRLLETFYDSARR